jgi:uncharacterized protein with HEPN domain
VKDDRVYLEHIRDAIHDIEQYTAGGRDAFMGDRMQQDAVIRKFEIIGEAVKHRLKTRRGDAQTFRGDASPACEID